MSTDRQSPLAPLLIVGSCTSLQFGAALATPLLASAGPGATTMMRLVLAGLILLPFCRPRVRRWDGAQWKAILLFALAMAGMNGCFYAAIARIPLAIAVTIEFIGPLVLAAVLSRRRRDLGWVLLAGTAIAVIGLTDAPTAGSLDPVGILFALASAGFWAFYILSGKRVSTDVPGHGALAVAMLVGALALAPFGAATLAPVFESAVSGARMLGVALLSSVVPYSLEFAALRRLSARSFGVLLCLEPVVAAIAGFALLSQTLTWLQLVAMAAVVTASLASTLASGRAPQSPPAEALERARTLPANALAAATTRPLAPAPPPGCDAAGPAC